MVFQLSDKTYLDGVILSAKDRQSLGFAVGSVMAFFRLGKFDGCSAICSGYLDLLVAMSCRLDALSNGLSPILFDKMIAVYRKEIDAAFDEHMGFLLDEAI